MMVSFFSTLPFLADVCIAAGDIWHTYGHFCWSNVALDILMQSLLVIALGCSAFFCVLVGFVIFASVILLMYDVLGVVSLGTLVLLVMEL